MASDDDGMWMADRQYRRPLTMLEFEEAVNVKLRPLTTIPEAASGQVSDGSGAGLQTEQTKMKKMEDVDGAEGADDACEQGGNSSASGQGQASMSEQDLPLA